MAKLEKNQWTLRQLTLLCVVWVGFSGSAMAEDVFRLMLEEPINGEIHGGVGNLRGWAVASEGIDKVEIFIDGEYAFDAPYGGSRGDVGGAFPEVTNAAQSGFSSAYAYSLLSSGTHTIAALAHTTAGTTKESAATFEVVKFKQAFISDPDAVDLNGTSCSVRSDEISVGNAQVDGDTYDLILDWRTAEQGFEIVKIDQVESPPIDGGGDSSGGDKAEPDFSGVDKSFQAFIDGNGVFDGISYVLVDTQGVIHQQVFGDHTAETIVMLASTSKVPSVMTLLALQEDPNVDFSISEPVSTYLPYDGVYADRSVEQMISNTSGIPGLRLIALYGSPVGPTLDDYNHLCQFGSQPLFDFEACGQTLVENELPNSRPAGRRFDYGGSQWQIAGVTAAAAANSTWNQLVGRYLGEPCGLDVFTFGNPFQDVSAWTGDINSLAGTSNPSIEGGAITNMADYAKLLQVHLNGGFCGDTQILSDASIASMQQDRGSVVRENATPYGMGWWIRRENPGVFTDPGAFGAVSFIDVNRGIGGYMAIDDYSDRDAGAPPAFFIGEMIPAIQAAYDAAQ